MMQIQLVNDISTVVSVATIVSAFCRDGGR